MNCHECQELLRLQAEGVLDEATSKRAAEHLAQCDACRAEEQSIRALHRRLVAAGNVPLQKGLDQRVMTEIQNRQVVLARRLKMRRCIEILAGAAIAAALLVSVTWAVLEHGGVRASAAEVVARGAQAASNLKSIYIKCRMRTLPGDNFQNLALDQKLVDVELWKSYGPPLKWRIEKPGRFAVMNGQQTALVMGGKYGVKFDRPSEAAFDTVWLHRLAAVDKVLAAELADATAAGYDTMTERRADSKNDAQERVRVDVRTNDKVGDYLKNKVLSASDMRREYVFDRATGRLAAAKFYCRDKQRDVLALEIVEIKYDPAIEDSRYEIQSPDAIAWSRDPERLPDNEKYEKLTPAEAARAFFNACAAKDWDEAAKFWPLPLEEEVKQDLGGLKIISLGKPFQAKPYGGWFVPYEIRLPSGRVQKHNLALRNDNPAKRYVVDGGL
jgi:hypothetical protein